MNGDKKTIGLTSGNREVMSQIMQKNLFKDQIDAAKFAMSLAINSDVRNGYAEGADTIWNVGSFDSNGELRTLMPLLFPNIENPYRLVEYLINAGLEIIGNYLANNKEIVFQDLVKMGFNPKKSALKNDAKKIP